MIRKINSPAEPKLGRGPKWYASVRQTFIFSDILPEMPRFFFNIVVRGRKAIPDPDGDELAGDKEARGHARTVAREMLSRRIWYKRGLEHWAFMITDKTGRQVAIVPFSTVESKSATAKLKKGN